MLFIPQEKVDPNICAGNRSRNGVKSLLGSSPRTKNIAMKPEVFCRRYDRIERINRIYENYRPAAAWNASTT